MTKITKTRWLQVVVAIVFVLALLLPVRTLCGARGAVCAAPPGADGLVSYYYEIEPLGVSMLETLLSHNFRIYYSNGSQK